jgi:glycosyltransferase involved in cell wall biosynthesis
LRIGFIIYGNLEPRSGGFLYDFRLVETLRAHGDEVEIHSQPWLPYPMRLLQNEDTGFLERLIAGNYDLILQDELNHPSLFVMNDRIKQQSSVPIISIVHHLRVSENASQLIKPLLKYIEKRYLKSIDQFIFNSHTTRGEVIKLIGRDSPHIVAYPGKDLLGNGLNAQEIRDRCQKMQPIRLLFVGNLIPRKGLYLAIQALGKLKDLSWTFDIVGDPNINPGHTYQLKNLVKNLGLGDRVFFHGRMETGRLFERIRGSQILLSPAQYEGFGITFVEGMGCGLPVITLKSGAAPEVIVDRETGILVSQNDVDDLTQGIRQLIEDAELLEKMSLAARRRFDHFPTWIESMNSIRFHLQEVVN